MTAVNSVADGRRTMNKLAQGCIRYARTGITDKRKGAYNMK